MRTTAAIVVCLALSSAAFGAERAPSQQVLADMGLGGMQILSDDVAANVRGMGFSGLNLPAFKHHVFKGIKHIKHDIHRAEKQVKHGIREVKAIFRPKKHH